MDINKIISIIRESKKAAKCPPGYKYNKKTKSCVPKRGKGIVLGYFGRYSHDHDHDENGKKKNGKNGNGSKMVMDRMAMDQMGMVEAVVLLMAAVEMDLLGVVMAEVENEDL